MLTIIMSIESEDDRDLVASIYDKYSISMKSIALDVLQSDHDAEDCVHETVITIIKRLEIFRRVNDEQQLKWLIFTVCKNTALNMLKRRKRIQGGEIPMTALDTGEDTYLNIVDDAPTPEEAAIEEDNVRFILSLINKLDEKYREVLLLKQSGFGNNDIAMMLGISSNAVRQRIFRARGLLLKMGGGRFYE